jgi:hypothetical protein
LSVAIGWVLLMKLQLTSTPLPQIHPQVDAGIADVLVMPGVWWYLAGFEIDVNPRMHQHHANATQRHANTIHHMQQSQWEKVGVERCLCCCL